jgi:thiol-disulfide isomerase/thioredoxin
MSVRRPLARAARAIPVLAMVAVAAATLTGCTNSANSKTFTFTSATAIGSVIPIAKRKPAEDISGPALSGNTKPSLASSLGHVTVVNFWAQWCGPCQSETPGLVQLYQLIHRQGVDFLGIDTNDVRGAARTFAKDSGITYPLIYDQQGEVALTLGNIPGDLPFTVLVDKHGRVAAVYIERFTMKDLQGALDQLLAES